MRRKMLTVLRRGEKKAYLWRGVVCGAAEGEAGTPERHLQSRCIKWELGPIILLLLVCPAMSCKASAVCS